MVSCGCLNLLPPRLTFWGPVPVLDWRIYAMDASQRSACSRTADSFWGSTRNRQSGKFCDLLSAGLIRVCTGCGRTSAWVGLVGLVRRGVVMCIAVGFTPCELLEPSALYFESWLHADSGRESRHWMQVARQNSISEFMSWSCEFTWAKSVSSANKVSRRNEFQAN